MHGDWPGDQTITLCGTAGIFRVKYLAAVRIAYKMT
jgi:hypothetical protein